MSLLLSDLFDDFEHVFFADYEDACFWWAIRFRTYHQEPSLIVASQYNEKDNLWDDDNTQHLNPPISLITQKLNALGKVSCLYPYIFSLI